MSKNILRRVNRISRLFQPVNVIPKNSKPTTEFTSKSYKLMIDVGIIRQASSGMYNLLPLGLRALDKLKIIVDEEMAKIDAQKILMPHLTSSELWKTTGRLETAGTELFTLEDRHKKQYILSPTHEEAITNLIASVSPLSYNMLPIRLYQVSSKWRDEMKPRLGLLRGREFIMKDLYTFDYCPDKARDTYDLVCHAYDELFRKIGVEFIKAVGHSGLIGGSHSNEYHYMSDIGEDHIVTCHNCNYFANTEVHGELACPKCAKNLHRNTAVEVGHTFLLGTKYSKPLQATFLADGMPMPLVMGCFGLGLTRILGAALEILSTDEELRWPSVLAPYSVCIIPPKAGSKEEPASYHAENFIEAIQQSGMDVIFDDRTHLTIGKRLLEARRTGYPYIVVIGKRAMETSPIFEVHDLSKGNRTDLNFEGIVDYLNTVNQDNREIRHEISKVCYKSI